MYTEFIIIYIGLAVLFVLLAVVLILLIKRCAIRMRHRPAKPYQGGSSTLGSGSMAFCKNCAASFDASLRVCPKCGTPR